MVLLNDLCSIQETRLLARLSLLGEASLQAVASERIPPSRCIEENKAFLLGAVSSRMRLYTLLEQEKNTGCHASLSSI